MPKLRASTSREQVLTLLLGDQRDDRQNDSEKEQYSLNEDRDAGRLELLASVGVAAVADTTLSDIVHIISAAVHPALEGQTGEGGCVRFSSTQLVLNRCMLT
jgi:hypothetical protein